MIGDSAVTTISSSIADRARMNSTLIDDPTPERVYRASAEVWLHSEASRPA